MHRDSLAYQFAALFRLNGGLDPEALSDALLLYHVSEEYDPSDPDEQEVRWDDPRVRHLWSTQSPTLSDRDANASS